MTRYVLTHPEFGIYVGSCLGLGFWTKLDPVDQPSVCTFGSPEEAKEFAASWDSTPDNLSTHPIEGESHEFAEQGPAVYASRALCVRNGLESWRISADDKN